MKAIVVHHCDNHTDSVIVEDSCPIISADSFQGCRNLSGSALEVAATLREEEIDGV